MCHCPLAVQKKKKKCLKTIFIFMHIVLPILTIDNFKYFEIIINKILILMYLNNISFLYL